MLASIKVKVVVDGLHHYLAGIEPRLSVVVVVGRLIANTD